MSEFFRNGSFNGAATPLQFNAVTASTGAAVNSGRRVCPMWFSAVRPSRWSPANADDGDKELDGADEI